MYGFYHLGGRGRVDDDYVVYPTTVGGVVYVGKVGVGSGPWLYVGVIVLEVLLVSIVLRMFGCAAAVSGMIRSIPVSRDDVMMCGVVSDDSVYVGVDVVSFCHVIAWHVDS